MGLVIPTLLGVTVLLVLIPSAARITPPFPLPGPLTFIHSLSTFQVPGTPLGAGGATEPKSLSLCNLHLDREGGEQQNPCLHGV